MIHSQHQYPAVGSRENVAVFHLPSVGKQNFAQSKFWRRGRGRVWGGANEPLASVGSGAKLQKKFLCSAHEGHISWPSVTNLLNTRITWNISIHRSTHDNIAKCQQSCNYCQSLSVYLLCTRSVSALFICKPVNHMRCILQDFLAYKLRVAFNSDSAPGLSQLMHMRWSMVSSPIL